MQTPLFDAGDYLEYDFSENRSRKKGAFKQRRVDVYLNGELILTVSSCGYDEVLSRTAIMDAARWAYRIRESRPSNQFIGIGFIVEYHGEYPIEP